MRLDSADDVVGAMARIRLAAQTHTDERDVAGLGWSEESVTDAAVHKGLPQVRVVQFNRNQEGGGVGADYLWWWLDRFSDDCFGMLVQAKRVDLSGSRPRVDISHRHGKQLGDLMRTAEYFHVPAMYSVYTGGPHCRRTLPCLHDKQPGCEVCLRMSILMITALQVYVDWEFPTKVADEVFFSGIALEDLVDPATRVDIEYVLPTVGAELKEFLFTEQSGPKDVAKRIFQRVVEQRNGAFSAAVAEPMTLAGERMFPEVPQDRGHYLAPYFEHVLRGLRLSPPDYVQDVLAGRPATAELTERAAGLVLVQM